MTSRRARGACREGTLAADYRSLSPLWAHKRTRPVPPKPSPESIQARMTWSLLASFLSFPYPSLTHLVPEASACPPLPALPRQPPSPLTCGSARGRWAQAGPGPVAGSARAGALLACGRAPCPRGPGRVARRGCPCTGSPGGPWAPPGGAFGLQTASRGAGGWGGR